MTIAAAPASRAGRVAAALRARPTLAAALLFALLAVVFVSPGLMPGTTLSNSDSFWFKAPWAAGKPAALERPANPEFDDAPAVLQPFVRFTARNLPDIPLWNPHIMTGRPFLADAQSAVFSPFNVPAYVLDFWTALGIIAALKLWMASFGAFCLGRRLGMAWGGAALAGTVYGFNLWLVTWLSYPHASVWALVPWLLVAADRVLERPSGGRVAVLGGVVGVQFLAGHPESSFHAVVAVVTFCALRSWPRRRGGWARPLAAVAAGGVAGLAVAAIAVLPFLELLLRSADLEQRAGSAAGAALPAKYLLGIFMPDHWGRPTQTPLELFQLARAFYGGALPLMLAAAALLLRPSAGRVAVAALGAACMAVVVGMWPVFDVVVRLPLFESGHNTRLAVLYLLCLALLAGWGFDDLLRHRSRRAVLLAAGIFLVPVAYSVLRGRTSWPALDDALRVAWGFAHPPGVQDPEVGEIVRGSALLIWIGVAGAALTVVAAAVRGGRGRWIAAVAVVAVFADLARAGMGYNPAIDRAVAEQPRTPAIDVVADAVPARFVATFAIPQNAIPMNYGLYEARGYDLPVERRFDRLWRRYVAPEFASQVGPYPAAIPLALYRVDADRLRVLGLLGVAHVMQPVSEPPFRVPGLSIVHRGPDARVYANPAVQAPAAVVGAQRVVRGEDAVLARVAAPGFAFAEEAVTEERIAGVDDRAPTPAGTATVVRGSDPDRLVVRARATRPGLLVVSDAWDPGWTATVDGRDAEVHRVNGVMRGVALGAGTHRVEFRYRPWSYRAGVIVSLVAVLALAAVAVVSRRRAARSPRPGARPAGAPQG